MVVRRVAMAFALAGIGLLATVTSPALGLNAPFLIPLVSVMLSAWYAGAATALLTLAVLLIGLDYFLLPPTGQLAATSGDLLRLGLFALVAIAMTILIERGRRTAATLQATLWNIADGVIVTDRYGRVTFLNPVAQRLTGWSQKEAHGRPVAEVYGLLDAYSHEPVTSRIESMLRDSVLREGTILGPPRERLLRSRDGHEQPILDSGASVVDERGSRVGAVIVFGDVSDQRAAREAAERANRLKDEFLATLSHELRTPLNAILGWTKMLRNRTLASGSMDRAIEAVDRNAGSLASLVSDLLDVSRIVTGRLRIVLAETDLSRLVRDTVDAISPAVAAKGVSLRANIEPVPLMRVDRERIRQVLYNLLSNAIKFTPSGGEISLTLTCVDSTVRLVVSDTGQGIDPDALPHVFNRFWQADSTSTRSVGGLGLGLAIVRHLVEAHEGTVTATSDGPDRGATLTVTLPLTSAAAPPPGTSLDAAPAPTDDQAASVGGLPQAGGG